MAERTEIKQVQCKDCALFLPDTVGNGQGLGNCTIYQNTPELDKQRVFIVLGNKQFWGGNDNINNRFCQKFESK